MNKRGSGDEESKTDVKRLAAVASSLSELPHSAAVNNDNDNDESRVDSRRLALVASSMAEESQVEVRRLWRELQESKMENASLAQRLIDFQHAQQEAAQRIQDLTNHATAELKERDARLEEAKANIRHLQQENKTIHDATAQAQAMLEQHAARSQAEITELRRELQDLREGGRADAALRREIDELKARLAATETDARRMAGLGSASAEMHPYPPNEPCDRDHESDRIDLNRLAALVSSLSEREVENGARDRIIAEVKEALAEAREEIRRQQLGAAEQIRRAQDDVRAARVEVDQAVQRADLSDLAYRNLEANHQEMKTRVTRENFVDAMRVANVLSTLAEMRSADPIVDRLQAENARLQAEIDGHLASAEDTRRQLNEAIERLAQRNLSADQLLSGLNELRGLLEQKDRAAEEKAAEARQLLAAKDARIAELQQDMNRLAERCGAQVAELESTIAGLRSQIAQPNPGPPPPLMPVDDEVAGLRAALASAEAARQAAVGQVGALNNQLQATIAERDQLRGQLQAASAERDQLQNQIGVLRARIDALGQEKHTLQQRIASLEASMAGLHREAGAVFNVNGQSSWDIARMVASREAFYSDVKQNLPPPFLPLLNAVFPGR